MYLIISTLKTAEVVNHMINGICHVTSYFSGSCTPKQHIRREWLVLHHRSWLQYVFVNPNKVLLTLFFWLIGKTYATSVEASTRILRRWSIFLLVEHYRPLSVSGTISWAAQHALGGPQAVFSLLDPLCWHTIASHCHLKVSIVGDYQAAKERSVSAPQLAVFGCVLGYCLI